MDTLKKITKPLRKYQLVLLLFSARII